MKNQFSNSVSAILLVISLSCLSAYASTVWNVNVGGNSVASSNAITTIDNYAGAASENTLNSTWNAVSSIALTTLADSTGNSIAGVTFKITPKVDSDINFGTQNLNVGDEIFNTWIKDDGNDDPFTVTFGNLPALVAGESYALIVYADWWWAPVGNPVEQTVGTGFTGTFIVNSQQGGSQVNGTIGPLLEDINPQNDSSLATNYARLDGLAADGSGNLSFTMGGVNAPINGLQLVKVTAVVNDATKPNPDPMTWASSPAANGSSSISMTATTANDTNGVEYFFDETSGNAGGSDSGWQDSSTYTDTGLNSETSYTYTVTARDKSAAQNTTAASPSASATTGVVTGSTVWNVTIGSPQITPADNFVGAATENTQNSIWSSITSVPQASMLLPDSTGSTVAGVTFDITSSHSIAGQALTSGDKIFVGYIGGAGATSNMKFKGLRVCRTEITL